MLEDFSDPAEAYKKTKKYLGSDAELYSSTRKDKKYMVQDPIGKWIHFGQMGYQDYTYHQDAKRRDAYLKRATKIKGNWKENPYSPNNLAIHILW